MRYRSGSLHKLAIEIMEPSQISAGNKISISIIVKRCLSACLFVYMSFIADQTAGRIGTYKIIQSSPPPNRAAHPGKIRGWFSSAKLRTAKLRTAKLRTAKLRTALMPMAKKPLS